MSVKSGDFDPRKIRDPFMSHHTHSRPYVYFEECADQTIKIGHVSNIKAGIARRKMYALHGSSLLAVVPGREVEEKELHLAFKSDLVRGNEWFRPSDEILTYVEALIASGFAAPTYEQAKYVATVDYSLWKPGSSALKYAIDQDGQISLFSMLPVRERIERLSAHFNGLSMTDDWFTPPIWVDLARAVMGHIDLDPASCQQANDECVRARYWYTRDLNGLDRRNKWWGCMWINPPYGTGENSAKSFMRRLYEEYTSGDVEQSVSCLNLNAMCNKWFVDYVAPIASAHCIPSERIEFIPPRGVDRSLGSATNGTVFTYVGPNVDRFVSMYRKNGQVLIPSGGALGSVGVAA